MLFFVAFLFGCEKERIPEPDDNTWEIAEDVSLENKCSIWLDILCSRDFGGRRTGSIYDEKTFSFLCQTISRMGYEIETQRFLSKGGQDSLRNVFVRIPGEIDSLIIIGSHYDGARLSDVSFHYPAANDNASGVVTNLALMDSIKRSGFKPRASVICAFWDGEESFDGTCFQGSSFFVNSLNNKEIIRFYLNLDSVGHEHVLYLRNRGHGAVEKALRTLLSNDRFSYVPVDMNKNSGGGSDYVSFGKAGIPYLNFCDHNGDMCEYKSHSEYDVVEAVSLNRIKKHILNVLDILCL